MYFIYIYKKMTNSPVLEKSTFFSMRADTDIASAIKLVSCFIHFPFILSQSAIKEPFVLFFS